MLTKVLTTGMGEVFSDYLIQLINSFIAVALAGIVLVFSLVLQFSVRQYVAWKYWFVGGLGLGKGLVSFISTVKIVFLVGSLLVSHKDTMHVLTVSE